MGQGVNSTPNLVISGGMDGRVIVWDKNMGISYNLHPAHPAGSFLQMQALE